MDTGRQVLLTTMAAVQAAQALQVELDEHQKIEALKLFAGGFDCTDPKCKCRSLPKGEAFREYVEAFYASVRAFQIGDIRDALALLPSLDVELDTHRRYRLVLADLALLIGEYGEGAPQLTELVAR